jgi:hypothetical protein
VKEYTLSTDDIGKVLRKSSKFVTKEILRGRLIGLKVGRTFRVAESDFENYVAGLVVIPPPEYSDLPGQEHFEFEAAMDPQLGSAMDPQLGSAMDPQLGSAVDPPFSPNNGYGNNGG